MKAIYTFLLLCIITFQIEDLKSQTTVTLGTATSIGNVSTLGYYHGYQRSAHLYTSAEIVTTGVISSINVKVATSGGQVLPFKVYLKTQSTSTISSNQTWSSVISGTTEVFNSSMTFNTTGWVTIDITDFTFSSNNLLVCFESNYGGTGASGYPTFYYLTAANKASFWYDNNSAPTGNEYTTGNRSHIQLNFIAAPTVTTTTATSITSTTASSGGNVTATGGASVIAKGVCYGTSTAPTIAGTKTSDGTGTGIFSSSITGLSAQTLYYYRAYATNSVGTSYGSESSFYTLATEPSGHSATFTATAANPNQINLSFSAASGYGADGYLILGYAGASAPSSSGVVDGLAYNAFSLVSPVTVITQITNSSATSYSHTALPSNTQYYYIIIPYNWDLTNPSTYNYLTAATIPSATATTPNGPSSEGIYIAGNLTNNGTIISTNDDNYMRMTGTSKTLSGTGTFTNTKYCVDGTITFTGTFAAGTMSETFVNTSKSFEVSTAKTFKNGLFTNYGTLTLTGTGIWENTGNYINNSTFTTASSSLLKFNGTSAQTMTELTPSTFSNVTIDNTTGVSMLSSITVANTLTLTNGKFIVGGNKTLCIGSASANGAISGGSSTSYIVAYDAGSTIGYVKHFVNANNVLHSYPIGDLTNYVPLTFTLTANSGLSGAYFTVYTKNVKIPSLNSSFSSYLQRFWEGVPNGMTSPTYTISYVYADGDISGSETNLKPIKKSGVNWYKPSGASFTTGQTQGTSTIDAANNTLTWSGLTTFSTYSAAGDQVVALPIETVQFNGQKTSIGNKLEWKTVSENQSDYFTIERTTDGQTFEIVGKVNGAGSTNKVVDYELIDANFINGINYYRLVRTNYDGLIIKTDLISIDNRIVEGTTKTVAYETNILGQEINEYYKGLVIIVYTDGSTMKVIR